MTISSAWYFVIGATIVVLAVVRAIADKRGRGLGIYHFLGRIEIAALIVLLGVLVILGCLQIFLRNFFHSGFIWAEPLMRHIVLWIGCLGGTLATARLQHINIDVFSRLIPDWAKPIRRAVVYSATATCAFVLGIAALRLVIDEKAFGETAFLNVQTWQLQVILPFAFFLMCYRSLVNLVLAREPSLSEGGEFGELEEETPQ